MATIRLRRGKKGKTYQAIVRRKGHPDLVQSFTRRTDAVNWANDLEADIRSGRLVQAPAMARLTVSQAMDVYHEEALPKKRATRVPLAMMKWWRARIGDFELGRVNRAIVKEHWDSVRGAISERTGANCSMHPART